MRRARRHSLRRRPRHRRYDVTVEVDVSLGLPQWTTVGLPASAVKESRERVGAALLNSGFTVPPRRITTNLAPADVRKEGTAFDLPIALGCSWVPARRRGCGGPAYVRRRARARRQRSTGAGRTVDRETAVCSPGCAADSALILPRANLAEASLVPTLPLAAPETLAELVGWLSAGVRCRRRSRGGVGRAATMRSTSRMSPVRRAPSARSRSPRPEGTARCSSVLPVRGRRCSPAGSRRSFRR